MYQVVFFVPETHLEKVKEALFGKGAGKYKNYSDCSWQIMGEGQFRPHEGSHPFLGQPGYIKRISEYRVEMICEDRFIREVLRELKKVHPYEEPAYYAYKVFTIAEMSKK